MVFQEIQCLHNSNHDDFRHITELYPSTKFHVCQCCGFSSVSSDDQSYIMFLCHEEAKLTFRGSNKLEYLQVNWFSSWVVHSYVICH